MRIFIHNNTRSETIISSKEYSEEEGNKVISDITDIIAGRGLATSYIIDYNNNYFLLTKSFIDGKLIEIYKDETPKTRNKVKKTKTTSTASTGP